MAGSAAPGKLRWILTAPSLVTAVAVLALAAVGQLRPPLAWFVGLAAVGTGALVLLYRHRAPPRWFFPLGLVIPGMAAILEMARRLANQASAVDQVVRVLTQYGLPVPIPSEVDRWRNSPPLADTADSCRRRCAALASAWLGQAGVGEATPDLVELLIREHARLDQAPLWPEQRDTLAAPLAGLFLRSTALLPSRAEVAGLSVSASMLEGWLRAMPQYNQAALANQVARLAALWRRVEELRGFLVHEEVLPRGVAGAGPAARFTATDLLGGLAAAGLGLDAGAQERQLVREALVIATKALAAPAVEAEPPDFGEAFALVALAAHLSGRGNTPEELADRDAVCMRAAPLDSAVRLVYAYLELRDEVAAAASGDPEHDLSLGRLVREWRSRVARREQDPGGGFKRVLQTIRDELREGRWPRRLAIVLEETFSRVRAESKVQPSLVPLAVARPGVLETLRRVFQNVDPRTIERYLTTRGVAAYMVTFYRGSGTVAQLLDCLTEPLAAKLLAKLGISLDAGPKHRYNFVRYTPSARIGILPAGESFDRFAAQLARDVGILLANREAILPLPGKPPAIPGGGNWDWVAQPLADVEVIAHRFGISQASYVELRNPWATAHAVLSLRGLMARHFDPAELLTVIEFEGCIDVLEMVSNAPLAELLAGFEVPGAAGPQVLFTARDCRALARIDDSLRLLLLAAVGLEPGTGAFLELGRRRLSSTLGEESVGFAADKSWSVVSGALPALDEPTWRTAVGAYFDILADLAAVAAGAGRG